MPNHVSNRVTFAAEHAEAVFAACCPEGRFDFRTLAPPPPNMYHGDLNSNDEKDFPVNWSTWNRQNWGTKWNAYECSHGVEDGKAFIAFQTAWNPPWPVMAAFANRFSIPFEHRYWDEGEHHWGIDTWATGRWRGKDDKSIQRTEKRYKHPDDRKPLMIQLTGIDWDAEEEVGE